ncbi:MAG TPA: glutaredoxin family protein [Syntrophorhabdaceae bacterium]|nr:glutaredoxin family protein [Syntrophorhabdaceae bacterium]HPU30284.1 glutaredoxin family protein [Syntrophorhabdaceae bacterium]
MEKKHVDGEKKLNLLLFALSTCIWCKKTKALLNELKAEYDYIDVDLLEAKEKDNALEELKRWNPNCTFPSLVIDNKECIIGYDEKRIKEILKS